MGGATYWQTADTETLIILDGDKCDKLSRLWLDFDALMDSVDLNEAILSVGTLLLINIFR